MTIAGMSVNKIRKNAVTKELKHIENSITKVGESVFSYEMSAGNKIGNEYFSQKYNKLLNNESLKVSLKDLQKQQYLKGINVNEGTGTFKSPDGKNNCSGYLLITKTDDGPVFKGCISCSEDYNTGCGGNGAQSVSLSSIR